MELRGGRGARRRGAALGRTGFVCLALALYSLAAVTATWPALGDARTHFLAGGAPGHGEAAAGDHLQTIYHLWLVGHQLAHGRAPWVDPYSFQPRGGTVWNPSGWPFGLPFWPLVASFGPVLGWNLFTLLVYVLAGGLACLWLRELGLPRRAALAGGVVFALAPYRVNQSVGHLLGPISVLLPLALYGVERARRGSAWWVALGGAAVASIPLSGQVHLALGAIPLFAAYAAVRLRRRRALAGAAAGIGAAAGAGLLVGLGVISGSIGSGGRNLREVARYSAEWPDFLARDERHGSESFVFLGWATPVLAAAGLVALVSARRFGIALVLGLAALVPVLLALGTNLPLYSPLWHALPPFRFPRVPERLMPIGSLAIAGLVGVFASRLPRHASVAAIVIALLFADLHVPTYGRSAADPDNAAYAAIEGPGRLLELPVFTPDLHFGSVYLYYDMQARRQRPFGYSTTAPTVAALRALQLAPLNCGDWSRDRERFLRALGVGTILLHLGLYVNNPVVSDTAWFAWRGLLAHGWRVTGTSDAVWSFRRGSGSTRAQLAEPSRDRAYFCAGWSRRGPGWVMTATRASFWVYGSRLRYVRVAPVRAFVAGPTLVDGRAARASATTASETVVPLGGRRWHLVTLTVPALVTVDDRRVGLRVLRVVPSG